MALLVLTGRAIAACADSISTDADAALPRQLMGLELEDSKSHPFRPFAATNSQAKIHVLIFVSIECPISNQYAPEIRRLYETYQGRGAKFWLVHPIPDETPEAIRRHATEYNLPEDILRDSSGRLTQWVGARVTPEAVVLDRELHVIYRGRIDDRFPALGRKRARATEFDLRDAIDAALAGRAIQRTRTEAVGCAIPRPK